MKIDSIDFLFSIHLVRVKRPVYNEKNGNIRFDAGLFENIQRQILIQIQFNEILYKFESDLKHLQKLADGYRHQVCLYGVFAFLEE